MSIEQQYEIFALRTRANEDERTIFKLARELAECDTALEEIGIIEYGPDQRRSVALGVAKLVAILNTAENRAGGLA